MGRVLPNFFIVGAPKAGTTSLYHYLDQHPQIYMSPIKEPCYFASEIRPENFSEEHRRQIEDDMAAIQQYLDGSKDVKRFGGIVTEWEDYLKLFQNAGDEPAIGEASVCYLWSQTAAARIRARIPAARIIMILRHPAERAFSQYLHAVTNGVVRKSFREHIETASRRTGDKFSVLYPFLEFGLYYEQLKRYFELFPRENVRVYLYEEYRSAPDRTLADVLSFLNVDASFRSDTSRQHLEPHAPRAAGITQFLKKHGVWERLKQLSPTPVRPLLRAAVFRPRKDLAIDPTDRSYLLDYYRGDIQRLATLLGRDLSVWLR